MVQMYFGNIYGIFHFVTYNIFANIPLSSFHHQDVSNKLQAMQICHESQCPEIARAVGKRHFEDEVYLGSVKLTVIDIIAMLYMLKHHTSAHTIK